MAKTRGLLYLRKGALSSALIVALFALGIAMLPYEWLGNLLIGKEGRVASFTGIAIIRVVGFALLCVACVSLRFRVFQPFGNRSIKQLLLCIPFLLVVINNAPWIALTTGQASVDASKAEIATFLVQCLCVAAFEELALRGIVLPLSLIGSKKSKRGVFFALMYSSAIFALMHLVNLFNGAGFPAVIRQVGYTFLIGAMCGLVMLKTHNLWLCILLHFVYNAGGLLIETLGAAGSQLWDMPTVIITVVLAVLVTGYGAWQYLRLDPESVKPLYEIPEEEPCAQVGEGVPPKQD